MIKKRSVQEWLELWGEWERFGRNYTSHLQPKSCLESSDILLLKDNFNPIPELSDDDAAWVCELMAIVKRERISHYRILKLVHINNLSMRRVGAFYHVSQNRAKEDYNFAMGYVEGLIEMSKGHLLLVG